MKPPTYLQSNLFLMGKIYFILIEYSFLLCNVSHYKSKGLHMLFHVEFKGSVLASKLIY